MQLQDLENEILILMQQQGLNSSTAPLPAPNWSSVSGFAYSQGVVDFAINLGYRRLMSDIANIGLFLETVTQPSVALTSDYPIPGTGNPAVALVHRIYYAPVGLLYTKEYTGQIEFKSWNDFQVQTGLGVLTPVAFGVQPQYVAVKPDRTKISFFPGSSGSGDVITVQYAPIPTAGTTLPLLVNATDALPLPDDVCEAIVYWALSILWAKGDEMQTSQMYRSMYADELKGIRLRYSQSSVNDGISITTMTPYADMRQSLGVF